MATDGIGQSYQPVSTYSTGGAGGAGSTTGTGGAGQPTSTEIQDLTNRLLELEGMLKNAGVDPTTGLKKPDVAERSSNVGSTGALGSLGSVEVQADMYSFMALFQKLAQQMRDTARTQRNTEMQAQVSALQGAADQMREAAAQRYTAAIVQGAMQIAGGVAQVGMSGASMAATFKGASLTESSKNTANFAKDPSMGSSQQATMNTRANSLEASGTKWTGTGQALNSAAMGVSGITGGIGGIVGAGFTNKADLADAKRAELEAQAKVHETAVGHASDLMQQMMDIIRDIRDKLSSIEQATLETNRGIARNI